MQTPLPLAAPAGTPRPGWRQQIGRALGVVMGIEVGLLLLTLPWTRLWNHSFWIVQLGSLHPVWAGLWNSSYLRGGVSGLGLIDLWIAASEITGFRL